MRKQKPVPLKPRSPAFLEGFTAFNCCVVRNGNPYLGSTESQAWDDWNHGWLVAKDMFETEELEG